MHTVTHLPAIQIVPGNNDRTVFDPAAQALQAALSLF